MKQKKKKRILYISCTYSNQKASFANKMKLNTHIVLGWQLSNCGFFLENQRQFFQFLELNNFIL